MTPIDKQLFSLFYDLKNTTEYMCNSDSLKNFYNDTSLLFENKLYSDINIQDKEGNTFLHYIAQSNHITWFIKILKHGANPLLINNKGKNPFQSFSQYDSLSKLWNNSALRVELNDFKEKTLYFSPEFKQLLLDNIRNISYKKISNIEDTLKDINMFSNKNFLTLLGKSYFISLEDKLQCVINNYSKEENSLFLDHNSYHFLSNYKNHLQIEQFFNLDFSQNENFNNFIKYLYIDSLDKSTQDTLIWEKTINLCISQQFDLKQLVTHKNLEEILMSNPESQAIYLEKTLNKENNHRVLRKI